MQNNAKEWLVRTRTGEILGPFTQRELVEELQRRAFSIDDEIAPSQGQWVSAQALGNRDVEEFTHTATRSQAFTRSLHTASQAIAQEPATQKILPPEEDEELTPTPDFNPRGFAAPPSRMGMEAPPVRRAPRQNREFNLPSRVAPLITLLFILAGAGVLISQMKMRKEGGPGQSPGGVGTPSGFPLSMGGGDTPFVRNIYDMINRGETKQALVQLTQYHERSPNKNDLEYLIPYSALLIMEHESPSRARKFLEQILSSGSVTAQLKAQAHHWLGYLLLSEDEGDKGESNFLDSLQLNTKDAASRFNLGRAYLKQEKFSQALDYFQLAELEKPDMWLIHIYKGRAKASLGNMEEARQSFITAIKCSPDRWISYMYYSVFLSKVVGETEAAQTIIKRMLSRDPKFEVNSPAPWGFFQEKINYSEYLNAFNEVMARAAGEEKEMGKLYINYLMNGREGNEGPKIEAVANKGGLMSKVIALKVALDREAPPDELKTAANRMPAALSDFGYFAYVLRGQARSQLGSFVEAQQDFKRALELEPKSALARFSMALLLKRMQRPDEAQAEMKGLLTLHPTYIPAIVISRTF